VTVDVDVFAGALVVEDVDVEVGIRVGASPVGALVVRDATGVREGSVGMVITSSPLDSARSSA
jgi:hypothetical protein